MRASSCSASPPPLPLPPEASVSANANGEAGATGCTACRPPTQGAGQRQAGPRGVSVCWIGGTWLEHRRALCSSTVSSTGSSGQGCSASLTCSHTHSPGARPPLRQWPAAGPAGAAAAAAPPAAAPRHAAGPPGLPPAAARSAGFGIETVQSSCRHQLHAVRAIRLAGWHTPIQAPPAQPSPPIQQGPPTCTRPALSACAASSC